MTSRFKLCFALLLAVPVSFGALAGQAQKKSPITFPTGYRHWTLVKTMVIFGDQHPLFKQFGGLHNVYVNDIGLPSVQQGRAYRDGSILVFDLHEIRNRQGSIETSGRKFVAVMKKNAKLYPETGGWGFEVFQGDEQKGSLQDAKKCFDCHASQKSRDYVFSAYTP